MSTREKRFRGFPVGPWLKKEKKAKKPTWNSFAMGTEGPGGGVEG